MATGGERGHGRTLADPGNASEDPADAERQSALAALKEDWGGTYEIGTAAVTDDTGTILHWVAFRRDAATPRPLIGPTARALTDAIRDDKTWRETR